MSLYRLCDLWGEIQFLIILICVICGEEKDYKLKIYR